MGAVPPRERVISYLRGLGEPVGLAAAIGMGVVVALGSYAKVGSRTPALVAGAAMLLIGWLVVMPLLRSEAAARSAQATSAREEQRPGSALSGLRAAMSAACVVVGIALVAAGRPAEGIALLAVAAIGVGWGLRRRP